MPAAAAAALRLRVEFHLAEAAAVDVRDAPFVTRDGYALGPLLPCGQLSLPLLQCLFENFCLLGYLVVQLGYFFL